MPTYEYVCAEGHAFEKIQKMSERPLRKCPSCGARAVRKVSGGAGLIFKGSGFYITDYGKDGKGARKEPAGDATPAASSGEGGASPAKTEAPAAAPAPAPAKKAAPKADPS